MKGKIYLSIIGVIILCLAVTYGVLNYNYSKGVRSGRLVKISKKGLLLKTYEGTLDLGSGDNLTWDFSVHDSDVGEKLSKMSGQIVRLEYRELLFKLFYTTKYDVLKFKMEHENNHGEEFCRLVNVLRTNKKIVDSIRTLIENQDPELLEIIRRCQQ